jgi:hydrogenase expression/formation protein HypC
MCLSIPSKVIKIDKETNMATVDTMGVSREASLDLMEEGSVKLGDYVLLHVGFIMNKIDEEDALESINVYKEIIEKMDEEDNKV